MGRVKPVILVTGMIIVLSAGAALPFQMSMRGKWWRNQEMVETLNLTEVQSKRIEKIFLSHRKELLELSYQMKQRYMALEDFVESTNQEELDRLRLDEMISSVHGVRSKLAKSRLIMLIEVRGILSPEQVETMKHMRKEMRGRRHRKGMGFGSHKKKMEAEKERKR